MNSARPPTLAIGTGPPRPSEPGPGGKRLSAEWSRLSPIRNTSPSGTTVFGVVVALAAVFVVEHEIAGAVGQGLAKGRQFVDDLPARQDRRGSELNSPRQGLHRTSANPREIWIGGSIVLRHRLAVEDYLAVDHRDAVARQADHALDVVLGLVRRHDDDDVAVFGRARRDPPVAARQHVEDSPRPSSSRRDTCSPPGGRRPAGSAPSSPRECRTAWR